MTETCTTSYNNLLKTLHGICIYSNLFYLTAGFYSLFTFSGYKRLMGVFILLIAIVSIIHHSNEQAGISVKFWSVLDVSLANIGAIIAMLILCFLIIKNRVHRPSGAITIIVALFSIVMFVFSQVESMRVKQLGSPNDPTKAWDGPLFTATEDTPTVNFKVMSEQAMYLVYHTIWHLTSGIAALMWVLTMNTHGKKSKTQKKKD